MLLLTHVQDMYKKALKMHSDSVNLRIRYAFFLLEYSESKDRALKQLAKAEQYKPSLDDSFVIYRYGRILQEGMADRKSQGGTVGMDAVSILAYNNYFRQCKMQLEKAAHFHIEFWSKLSAHIPDVGQLIITGTRISKTIVDIESYWGQMQKINPNTPKAVKMYAEFLRSVLHDDEAAQSLLKSIANQLMQKGTEFGQSCESDQGYLVQTYGRGGIPCVCASGDTRNLGHINNVNSSFCRMTGMPRSRLIGQHVNVIVPEIIAENHNKFMFHAAEYRDDVHVLNKERWVPCKISNGYLMMVYLTLKSLPSFVNNMNFVCIFKMDRMSETKEVCYLLLDTKGYVCDISESISFPGPTIAIEAVPILNLTLHAIKSKKTLATEFFTDFVFEDTHQYKGDGKIVTFKRPKKKLDEASISQLHTHTYIELYLCDGQNVALKTKTSDELRCLQKDVDLVQFKCTAYEVSNVTVGTIGYVLKLVPYDVISRTMNSMRTFDNRISNPKLQFVLNQDKGRYCRIIASNFSANAGTDTDKYNVPASSPKAGGEPPEQKSESDSGSSISEESKEVLAPIIIKESALEHRPGSVHELINDSSRYSFEQFMQAIEILKKNYGDGVVTRQLVDGKRKRVKRQPLMIKTIYSPEDEESEDTKAPVSTNVARESALEKARIGKVKTKMRSSIEHFPVPGHITNLQLVSLALVASFVVLTVVEYVLSESTLNKAGDSISLAWMKGRLFALLGEGYNLASMLALTSSGVITNYENATSKSAYVTMLRAQTKQLANVLQQDVLSFAEICKSARTDIQQFLWTKDVALTTFSPSGARAAVDNYTLYESIVSINEAIVAVKSTPLADLSLSNSDVLFVRYNYLNSMLVKCNVSRGLDIPNDIVYKNTNTGSLTVIMICAFVVNFAAAMLIVPFILKANYIKEKSLTAFLCIPKNVINQLQEKCEHFLSIYDTEKEPEDEQTVRGSQPENAHAAHTYMPLAGSGVEIRSKRKFQKSSGEKFFLLFKVSFVMVLLDSYFIFAYIFVRYVQTVLEKRCISIVAGGDLSAMAFASFAVLREAVMRSSTTVGFNYAPADAANTYLELYRKLCEDLLQVVGDA
ncbi:MAG: PAS domain S-box protein [Candidatus Pacebacteria bacterium]|nr:PAS domain S-box protein [Candidatus Paceibacterota bacterium]